MDASWPWWWCSDDKHPARVVLAWGTQTRIQRTAVGRYHNPIWRFFGHPKDKNTRSSHFEKEFAGFVGPKLQIWGEGAHRRCGLNKDTHTDMPVYIHKHSDLTLHPFLRETMYHQVSESDRLCPVFCLYQVKTKGKNICT